jgi:hypothetical protein
MVTVFGYVAAPDAKNVLVNQGVDSLPSGVALVVNCPSLLKD